MIEDIKTPNELLEYMNKNIRYGWLDENNQEHIDTMKEFRNRYRTLTIEETLLNHLGTCIEQTNLEMAVMEKLAIPYKAFCLRSYKDDVRIIDPKMHCFLLFFIDDKCYHFEHSNPEVRGIHEYKNEDSAMQEILAYYQARDQGKTRQLLEIHEVPAGLSWEDWNSYLDELAKEDQKSL